MAYKTFFSNNTHALMAALFKAISFKKCLHSKVTVLVPNRGFLEIFYSYLVDYKNVNISMFLRVKTLEEGMYCFKRRGVGVTVNFQSFRLLIINILKKGHYFKDVCKSNKDLQSLSKRLASIFMRYRLATNQNLEEWLKKGGQIQEIFIKTLTSFPLLKKEDFVFPQDHDIHFFGFDTIAAIYHEILFSKKLGSLYFYFLSPSDSYWGDVVSKNTQFFLRKKFNKRGVDESQIDLFESITSDTNPLLSNFSKACKPLYTRLVDETECFDLYLPDFFSSDLEKLRESIFHQSPNKIIAKEDSSFQVMGASSRLREIEILFDSLLEAFCKNELAQRHVQVFAPDIGQYLSEIQHVFCCPSSPFQVKVQGLKNTVNNLWMQTFSNFFEFLSKPFSLHLLERFIFSKTFSFIYFSDDDRILFNDYFLLKGSYKKTRESFFENIAFRDEIPFEKSESLANLMTVIDRLERLHHEVKLKLATIADWSGFFVDLIETYFQSDESEGQVLDAMLEMSELNDSLEVDFQTIVDVFDDLFNKKVGVFQSHGSNAIVFCNLSLEAIVPKKRIYCLGLDEESFVRHEAIDVLSDKDLLEQTLVPLSNQVDRACILKMILNASDSLEFSYTNISPTDGKRIDESLVLKECLDFLALKSVESPLLSFDASYFQKDSFKNETSFRLAQSYYQKCDYKVYDLEPKEDVQKSLERIDIDDLNALLSHPLRFFAKKSLGLYLESFEKEPMEAKEFFVSYGKMKGLVERSLIQGVDKTFDEMGLKTEILSKSWFNAAKLSVQKKVNELLVSFVNLGIKKEDLFSQDVRLDLGDSNKIIVHGTLDLLSNQGLLVHEKTRMQGIFKNWAKIVVLNCLHEKDCCIDRAVCFSANAKKIDFRLEDPFAALKSLLAYYKKAKEAPSLLMADNVECFMKEREIKRASPSFFHDPYCDLLQEQQISFTKEIEEMCKYINV